MKKHDAVCDWSTALGLSEPLLAAAKQGSKEATGRLLEACGTRLAALARRRLPRRLASKVDVADIVQETCLRACRHFHHFRGTTSGDLLRWLRRILVNHVIDTVRHHGAMAEVPWREWACPASSGRRAQCEAANRACDPRLQSGQREEARHVHRALRRLPADYRCVVAWRNHQGLSFRQIGQRLGCSSEAARKLWTRALLKLQHELETSWKCVGESTARKSCRPTVRIAVRAAYRA